MEITVQLGAVVGFLLMAAGCIGSCIICGNGAGRDFGPAYYLNVLMLMFTMVGSVLMFKFS